MNHFITSDGRKIDFVKGWYEKKSVWPFGITNIKDFSEQIYSGCPGYPTGYGFFVNKLVVFNYFQEILNETFVSPPKKWRRALDIGTGPGIQPRLMKGSGMCEEVWGNDIVDRSKEFYDSYIPLYIEDLKNDLAMLTEGVLTIVKSRSAVLSGNNYPFHVPYTAFSASSDYSTDKYITADFMTHDFGNEKFDIITSIFVIEYFDSKALFEKICSLLNPGGLFFVMVGNWYEVFGVSMNLPMDAPWLHARVTRKDLNRYYDEARPEIAPYAKKCIYFVESHLTPIDYNKRATEAGLRLLTYRRNVIPDIVLPITTGDKGKVFYSEILPQAKLINPNVEATDLLTYYLTMMFVKEQ